jgi:NitT/TauT family transport system ATP-binding protein
MSPWEAGADSGMPQDLRLRVNDVTFRYTADRLVLGGVSLQVKVGENIGIVGPSGCGKSTLLSLLAGLRQPTSGSIRWNVEGGRHPLSMVFQKDTLLPWLTVAENVRLYSRFQGGRRRWLRRTGRRPPPSMADDSDARISELLTMVGLEEMAGAYPYQLSGGMRRRVAFLAAVAPNPQVLLLDEPFSSVDEPTRIGIHQDAFRITRMLSMTTILVTHDLAEAISLSDRVITLSRAPALIVHDDAVEFGHEREMLAIRETDDYLDLYRMLWHNLSAEIASTFWPPRPQPVAMDMGVENASRD